MSLGNPFIMTIESNNPLVSALCKEVEKVFNKFPGSSSDFRDLSEDIRKKTKKSISQSTLERLWGYGRQKYSGISLHTLDILSNYSGFNHWNSFIVEYEKRYLRESDEFQSFRVISRSLKKGTRLKIGWKPDRLCVIRYLGDEKFIAEECHNSTMQPGATFTCMQFQLGRELVMNNFKKDSEDCEAGKTYVAGMNNGLLSLEIL